MDARGTQGHLVSAPTSRALAAATLASLPGITAARLTALLDGFGGDPERALLAVREGRAGPALAASSRIRKPYEVTARWRGAVPAASVKAVVTPASNPNLARFRRRLSHSRSRAGAPGGAAR